MPASRAFQRTKYFFCDLYVIEYVEKPEMLLVSLWKSHNHKKLQQLAA